MYVKFSPFRAPKCMPKILRGATQAKLYMNRQNIVYLVDEYNYAWVDVFRIIHEFKILRLTFYRKPALKCLIKHIIITSLITYPFV